MVNFQGFEHKLRFDKSRDELNDDQRTNVRYLSVLYTMTSSQSLTDKMAQFFINGELQMQDFLIYNEFNQREQLLVKISTDLFAENYTISNNDDLINELNEDEFNLVLEAIRYRVIGLPDRYEARSGDMYLKT